MSCSGCIGRVGALAVFLGVGVSMTTAHGIACAEPTATGSSATGTPSTTTGTAGADKTIRRHPTNPVAATPSSATGSSGNNGSTQLTAAIDALLGKTKHSSGTATSDPTARPQSASTHPHTSAAHTSSQPVSAAAVQPPHPAAQPVSVAAQSPSAATNVSPTAAAAVTVAAVSTASAPPAGTTSAASTPSTQTIHTVLNAVVTAAKQLMQAILGPLVSTLPSNVPAGSPALWTMLAWVRKQFETNLFPTQAVPASPVTSDNLLVNPSAEFGDPSLSGNSSVTVPGWTVTGTPTVIKYGTLYRIPLGFPIAGPVVGAFPKDPPAAGDTQFFGGGNVGTSTLSQTVNLSGATAAIDQGSLPYQLSGWLGGASFDFSSASVAVHFLDAQGKQLGVGTIAPVSPFDRWFKNGMIERDTSGTVPVGTRSAQVVVTLKDASSGYNNAFADDLSFTVGADLPAPPTPQRPSSTVGQLDHVFMVYLENKGYSDIVGSPNAPYINSLINTYGVATDYYALTHPSDPNYYPILGGSDFGLSYNCATNCIDATNLADKIEAAGKTWAGYAQGMSDAGPYTATSDYAPDQLPFLAYHDIYNDPTRANSHLFPLTKLATDLGSTATAPNYAWFAANEANNMEGPIDSLSGILSYAWGLLTNHQYNVAAGDKFLQDTIPTITGSKVWTDPTQKSAIVITVDEDSNNLSTGLANEGNRVVTIVIPSPAAEAAGMRSGQFDVGDYANHYSLLSTIEYALGLTPLTNNDKYAQPMNGFWGPAPTAAV